MGFFDKLKFNGQDFEDSESVEENDYEYEYEDEQPEAVQEEKKVTPAAAPVRETPKSGMNVSGTASLELKVVRPKEFDSVPQIADHLLNRRTVVLILDET